MQRYSMLCGFAEFALISLSRSWFERDTIRHGTLEVEANHKIDYASRTKISLNLTNVSTFANV
jgi:hypothetical protein